MTRSIDIHKCDDKAERNKWKQAVDELRGAQTAVMKKHHKRSILDVPGSDHMYAYITDDGYPKGLDIEATEDLSAVDFVRIKVPFKFTSGVQLQAAVKKEARLRDRRKRFKVVRRAA